MKRPRRSELRRTLYGLVVLLSIAAATAAVYVHHVWNHSDKLLEQVVRQNLTGLVPGCRIEFVGCRFDLLRRVRLDKVTLYSESHERALVKIPEVIVAIDRQALAKRQQLVIQHIKLYRPRCSLNRDKSGHWDWQSLKLAEKSRMPLPEWQIVDATLEIAIEADTPQQQSLDIDRLQLVPAGQDRYILEVTATKPAVAGHQQPTQLSAQGHWNVDTGTIAVDGNAKSLILDSRLQDFLAALVPASAPVSSDDLPGRLARSRLVGQGQLSFRVGREQSGAAWDYKCLLQLTTGTVAIPELSSLPGLPRHFSDLAGKLYFDARHIQFKQFAGTVADSRFTINGLIDRGVTPATGQLEVTLQNVALDQRFRGRLPASWQTMFDTYSPRGHIDVTCMLRTTEAGTWRPADSVITARGCSVRHAHFPYPLENITGTLTQLDTTRDMRVQVNALASERPVTFRGTIHNIGPEAESQIAVSVSRLPLDETFRAAVKPGVQRTLDALDLHGSVDIQAHLTRPAGPDRKMHTRLAARLVNSQVRYEKFPWPLERLGGEITAELTPTNHRWTFKDLSARHGTATLSGSGHYSGSPGKPGQLALDIRARDVTIDKELKAACSVAQRRLWDRVSPTGRFEGHIEIRRLGTGPASVEIPHFELTQASLRLSGFPYPLNQVHATGSYQLHNGTTRRLKMNDFQGRHRRTLVESAVGLEVVTNGDWTLRLDKLSVQRLTTDRDLRQALPPALRGVVSQLNPQGELQLRGTVELRGTEEQGYPITAAWDLETHLANNRLTAGVYLEDVSGRIRSRGKWFGRHADMAGEFDLDGVSLWGYRFRQVRGPFRLRDRDLIIGSSLAFAPEDPKRSSQEIAPADRVTAHAVGGLFTLDAQARLAEPTTYHVKMNMSEAHLHQFAKEYMKGRRNLKGLMRGWIDLRGAGQSPANITGRGQLQISPAELYELPIIVQLFDVLSLGPPEQSAFRYAQCDFQMARSQFQFNTIDLVGNSLQLRGRGTASFDGLVDLDFYSMLPRTRVPLLPFIQPLIGQLTTGWVAVDVNGRAEAPQARIRPAPVLDDALKRFLSALENPGGRRAPPPLQPPDIRQRAPLSSRQLNLKRRSERALR